MVRRVVVGVLAIIFLSAPLAAQRVEVSFSGGYTASEGINIDDRVILGDVYNKAGVNSGGSFSFAGGVYVTPQVIIEFQYARQMSKLTAEGPAVKLDAAELNVDNYHVNFVYNWGESDAKVRPFAFGGLGATSYEFGNLLIPGTTGSVAGNTQFSTTWGAGVKFFPAPAFGIKLQGRWTPTYIKSDAAGYWCDPFYGCWLLADPDYSNQFDISGGFIIRF